MAPVKIRPAEKNWTLRSHGTAKHFRHFLSLTFVGYLQTLKLPHRVLARRILGQNFFL